MCFVCSMLPLSLDCSFCFFITFIISSECNVYRVNSVYIVEGLNKTYFFLCNHMIMVLVDSLLISDDVCVV